MSTMSDLFRAVSRVVAIGDRIADLSDRLNHLERSHNETRERLVRIEAFLTFAQPAIQKNKPDED